MNERWTWTIRYAVVILIAIVLAAALGATDLFVKTRLIDKGLSASHLVRFLGYGVRRHVGVLDRYNIPAPVVGGFLFAAVALALRLGGVLAPCMPVV